MHPAPASLPSLEGLPLRRHELVLGGRRWSIDAVGDQDVLLDASDRFAVFPFGLLLWESSMALAAALVDRASAVHGATILEIGAGTGLAGLVAASLGAHVRQTDHLAEAIALCRHNAALNGVGGITTALADWTRWTDDARYDLVVGADVLYDRAAHAPVRDILHRNLAEGGRALLTDPGRIDTPAFIGNLRAAGWRIETSVRDVPVIAPVRPHQSIAITLIDCSRPTSLEAR